MDVSTNKAKSKLNASSDVEIKRHNSKNQLVVIYVYANKGSHLDVYRVPRRSGKLDSSEGQNCKTGNNIQAAS